MCVVNTRDGVIPNPVTPESERYRDLSKLYVAMTRAKLQLVLSYSNRPSTYICGADEQLLTGKWTEYLSEVDAPNLGRPRELDHYDDPEDSRPVRSMTGEEFLYTRDAFGISTRLIVKLRDLVTGRKRFLDRVPIAWGSLSEAARDVRNYPGSRQRFGPEVVKEFEVLVDKLNIGAKRQ